MGESRRTAGFIEDGASDIAVTFGGVSRRAEQEQRKGRHPTLLRTTVGGEHTEWFHWRMTTRNVDLRVSSITVRVKQPTKYSRDKIGTHVVRITISKENYLKAIAEAESEGEDVKAVTLTRWLQVSAPAVTMAVKRLKRDELIRVGKAGLITLTEQLEHAVSADFERKLVERLGTGGACPHGNIVGSDSPRARRRRGLKPLEEARSHEHLTVVSVFERDRKLLEHLESLGIRPGVELEVVAAQPEIQLEAGGRAVGLARNVASKVWVRTL